MPASADYLTKYLTAASSKSSSAANPDFEDSSRPKKRRKKDKHANASTTGSLLIADDDDGLLLSTQRKKPQDDDEDIPLIYEGKVRSAEFRKKKDSAWATVQEDVPVRQEQNGGVNGEDDDEATHILAQATAESDARRAEVEMEDAPAVVETPQTQDGPTMSSGVRAGLQTASDTAALVRAEEERHREEEERRKARKKKARTKSGHDDEQPDPTNETIYRDATGRRIDISLRRAELARAEAAKLAAEKKERENAMGDVQLQAREKAKEDLENAKFLTLGRSAEDEELNEAQREELRWDDPMAGYMAERQAEREAKNPNLGRRRKEEGETVSEGGGVKKRVYLGAAPPNRYGIKPGWRWDGVDRGNGFEKEWFQARGKKNRIEELSYQWQMDE
ncbi:Pre-mRNA-splicing factor cwc26 [Knufia obscura]|uniref:Pre-mRNA-splicing factor cwc26 n=2 Tax=Knufia TaxID=430999 RepID=A0AAN8EIS1_9EURO|nr:Pre-mRNA-splicing factor cwc26 [Knufia obscura]KAK5954925.1 Pre-mRNA-splicing factor cwc26 [Knufia fluminis]